MKKLIPTRIIARWNLTYGPSPPPLDRDSGFPVGELSEYLHSKTIEIAPVKTDEDVPQCSICLEEINEGGEAVKLDCQHIYHTECVKLWFYRKDNCPLCKKVCKGVPRPRHLNNQVEPPALQWEMMTFGLDAPIVLDFNNRIPFNGVYDEDNIPQQIIAD